MNALYSKPVAVAKATAAAHSIAFPLRRNAAASLVLAVALLGLGGWRQGTGIPSTYSAKSESSGSANYHVSLPGRGANNYAVLYEADRLVKKNLRYTWGSANETRGGLDCSGFVMAIYKEVYGVSLPDESNKQYEWLKTHGKVWDATSGWNSSMLQPGDLVFYSGTINNGRNHPVTHVMIWCGGNVVAGAQYSGPRLNGSSAGGVAYFPQRAFDPKGDPAKPLSFYRGIGRIYGYGRFSPGMAERENERRFLAGLQQKEEPVMPKPGTAPGVLVADKDKGKAKAAANSNLTSVVTPGPDVVQISRVSQQQQSTRWRSWRYKRNAAAAATANVNGAGQTLTPAPASTSASPASSSATINSARATGSAEASSPAATAPAPSPAAAAPEPAHSSPAPAAEPSATGDGNEG